jgi:LmbE family N-acetylglucosaminyl deacetylase
LKQGPDGVGFLWLTRHRPPICMAANLICLATYAVEFVHVGGTLMKHGRGGWSGAIVGIEYDDEQKEQIRAAADVLGIDVYFLDLPRGNVWPTVEAKKKAARIIRENRPDVAIMYDPQEAWGPGDPDRVATYEIFRDAIPHAARPTFAPEQIDEGLKPHAVKAIYYPTFDKPDCVVDISGFYSKKRKAEDALKFQVVTSTEAWRAIVPESVFRSLVVNYEQLKGDSYELGKAVSEIMENARHIIQGTRGRTALGETFRRELRNGVYTFDQLPI